MTIETTVMGKPKTVMGKPKTNVMGEPKTKEPPKMSDVVANERLNALRGVVANATTLHREVLNRLLDPQSDVDAACGYIQNLDKNHYRDMFDRMGLAKRVVSIWPDECWQTPPQIYEKEGPEETKFETAWKELEINLSIFSYLHRIDILSGISDFGVLFLGINDGADLAKGISGIDETTGEVSEKIEERELLYLRAFDHSVLSIDTYETDVESPRYGKPKQYSISFREKGAQSSIINRRVHWTRVIHVADNRETSEVHGVSRLKAVYNNLCDIKKVSGGSGEMFWKGGFPGYSFELTPEAAAMGAEIDSESVKEQLQLYSTGLQRWLALTGVTAKSLTPQVANPVGHVEIHLKLVALALGVPYRVLLGSEEAKLASVQDKRTWNGRLMRRQNNYLSPMLVRPFLDRLIAAGCLPRPEKYFVLWPDLNVATEDDVAKVALSRTDAFSKYVSGGVDGLVPPRQYFTQIHKMSDEEANMIIKEQEKYESQLAPEEESQSHPTEALDGDKNGS